MAGRVRGGSSFDAASTLACSPLTPHRSRFLFALSASGLLEREALACSPTRGERGDCCSVATKHAYPLPRRLCARAVHFLCPQAMRGMARRKAQILMARVFGKTRRRLSARHMRISKLAERACYLRRFIGAGPCFPVRTSRSSRPAAGSATKSRSNRPEADSATPKSSASS